MRPDLVIEAIVELTYSCARLLELIDRVKAKSCSGRLVDDILHGSAWSVGWERAKPPVYLALAYLAVKVGRVIWKKG